MCKMTPDRLKAGDTITCSDKIKAAGYINALDSFGYSWMAETDIKTGKILITIIRSPEEDADE